MLDGSGATFGPDFLVRNHARGLDLRNVPAEGVTIDGFEIESVSGVGVLVGPGSKAIALRNGKITGTKNTVIPVGAGTATVGDGVEWLGGEMKVDATVVIDASGRKPAVIDASALGSFSATLTGADATTGIVVQGGTGTSMPPGLIIAPGITIDRRPSSSALPTFTP